jgi:hypothetical protein
VNEGDIVVDFIGSVLGVLVTWVVLAFIGRASQQLSRG